MTPYQRIRDAIDHAGAPLSIGLEPRAGSMLRDDTPITADSIESFCRIIIENTHDLAAAYKPNLAFFEAFGAPGWEALERLHTFIPSHAVLLADAKRGDIGSTAAAYALAIHDRVRAHAVTINPLMGYDAVEPFLHHAAKPFVYLLALTSNPGASDFLVPECAAEDSLAERIAMKAAAWDGGTESIGLVVGATRDAQDLARIHRAAPELPWLVPGVGAQGGAVSSVVSARVDNWSPEQALIHATRSLMPASGEQASAIREKAAAFHAHLKASFNPETLKQP